MHDRPCGWVADEKREALLIGNPSTSAETFRRSLGCESGPVFLNLTRVRQGKP